MSRAQRRTNATRCQTQQIRAILMNGPTYQTTHYMPAVKVSTGNADPTR